MADEESRESKNRYRQLIRTSPAPVNLFDASGGIIWGNDAVVDLLGLDSRSQLVGRSIFDFIVPEDRYTAERELTDVVDGETATGPTSMTLQRIDGTTRSIRVSTAPGRYQGRNIGQAVIIDVTETERVRGELERERQFIEDALNTLQDVFYVVNPSGELERWNDSLLDISGYAEDEVEDLTIEDFFVEEHTSRVSRSIATALAEGADVLEATVVTKAGNRIPYEFRKRRLTNDGNVVGLVGIGRDVSAQRAREQHLRSVDHLLQHNLRNQLNIIQGTIDLLQGRVGTENAAHVDRIDAATGRLLSIFENHNRIVEQLTAQQTPQSVDVVPMVESVVRTRRDVYPAATISCVLPESATVQALPALEQALVEVLDNAIGHNDRSAPQADVTVETTESTVTIRISDDGPTIPEMEYRTLSDESLLDSTYHSTGLGLWFVHQVVTRSDGSLQFDRGERRGNVVTIELPTPPARWTE